MTMEVTYKQAGDYLIPDLEVDGADEWEEMPLGKYGMLRETFLEEHHPGTYTSMLLTGRLYPHLREIDRQAREQVDRMVNELKKQNGVDEAMKARDQMGWGRLSCRISESTCGLGEGPSYTETVCQKQSKRTDF